MHGICKGNADTAATTKGSNRKEKQRSQTEIAASEKAVHNGCIFKSKAEQLLDNYFRGDHCQGK